MELVLRNPFRVLGIPVTASSREIAKRVSDLEMFAELGKEKSYPLDLPELGEIDRSLESIKDASRRIELPEMRVFYSFFWFRTGDAVDELALECLSNLELSEADSIWCKQIEKSDGLGKLSWHVNRAVFSLWMSDNLELGTSHFEQALEDIGFVTDELYANVIGGVPGADQVSADRIRVLISDALVSHAAESASKCYGPNAIRLIDHCWSFNFATYEYIKARVTKPLINQIQDLIDRSKLKREAGTTVDDLRRKNGLLKGENIIYELRDSLGVSNPTFQAVANSFADEVLECAINAINRHKAVPTAIVLAEWAEELPSFGQTRKWIMNQRQKIFAWDPDYQQEDGPDDSTEDDCETEELSDQDQFPEDTIICPKCSKKFVRKDVKEFTGFGVRCPACNQSIVIV